MWLGAVGPDRASIVAGGLLRTDEAAVVVWPADLSASAQQVAASVDDDGLARFDVEGLAPDTDYAYLVVDDPADPIEADDLVNAVTFRTHDEGAQDLVVVFTAGNFYAYGPLHTGTLIASYILESITG